MLAVNVADTVAQRDIQIDVVVIDGPDVLFVVSMMLMMVIMATMITIVSGTNQHAEPNAKQEGGA